MQSYEHHVVQESLQKRHPYLQDQLGREVIPDQITVAVFDRTIEKFKDVLLVSDLDPAKVRDALKTLNELIHHQETASQMIDADIIAITSALMKHRDAEVREQAALLVGQFALHQRAASQLFEHSFLYLNELLEDSNQDVRNAAALVFLKLSINSYGRESIRDTNSANQMIKSFISHSRQDSIAKEKGLYLIRLLESFVNLTFNDYGIEPLLGKGAISQFSTLLAAQFAINNLSPEDHAQICQLSLRVLGNMSVNHAGKDECIANQVIKSSSWFLDETLTDSYDDALNASLVIMSCSIHLDGKKQIVEELDENHEPRIIKLMIARLQKENEQPELRKNLKVALINVSELPIGFLRICHDLASKVSILDEIFGPKSVKGLHQLLPKLSQYQFPPEIRGDPQLDDKLENYRMYIKAMAMIFGKYGEEAAQVAMNETINFSEKLAPFVNPDLMLQKDVFVCLNEMKIDTYNCHILHKFLQEYGNHRLQSVASNGGITQITTLMSEFQSENPDLLEHIEPMGL